MIVGEMVAHPYSSRASSMTFSASLTRTAMGSLDAARAYASLARVGGSKTTMAASTSAVVLSPSPGCSVSGGTRDGEMVLKL